MYPKDRKECVVLTVTNSTDVSSTYFKAKQDIRICRVCKIVKTANFESQNAVHRETIEFLTLFLN